MNRLAVRSIIERLRNDQAVRDGLPSTLAELPAFLTLSEREKALFLELRAEDLEDVRHLTVEEIVDVVMREGAPSARGPVLTQILVHCENHLPSLPMVFVKRSITGLYRYLCPTCGSFRELRKTLFGNIRIQA